MSGRLFPGCPDGLLLFQGLGTDEETLIEIVCSRNNEEMVEIKKVYRERKALFLLGPDPDVIQMCECVWLTPAFLSSVFKKELDKDIAGDTSGDFAKLLLALVQVASMLAAHSLMTPG